MSPPPTRTALRVLVCGATFGRFYLEGIRSRPDAYRPAGLLARGGPRAVRLAERYGLPLYTTVDELPAGIDVACVVVRSGVVGGPGSELAEALLTRGIHVLQEQPVHHDELVTLLRTAARRGVHYRLNPFYRHIEPVARFLAAATRLRARQQPMFVDAACAIQVAYPMVDILGQALGGLRPWRIDEVDAGGGPFRTVQGTVARVPVTLRVQNQIHPDDPDNHAHLLHRVTIGTRGGVLTLTDAHGLVLWSPRMHVGRTPDGDLLLDDSLDLPATAALGPATAPSQREVMATVWPRAVAAALDGLRAAIDGGPPTENQFALGACALWQEVTSRLGRPDLVRLPDAEPLHPADLDPQLVREGAR